MGFKCRVVLACTVFCYVSSALGQEQVTVEQARGMIGLWRISIPASIRMTIFKKTSFGAMRSIFCRIDEHNEIHCLNGGFSNQGEVSVSQDRFRISWGTAMARFAVDGQRNGDVLSGRFRFIFSGIGHDAPELSIGERIGHADEGPTVESSTFIEKLKASPPGAVAKYGVLQAATFLGTSPKLDGEGEADFFNVYALEYDTVQVLCGFHGEIATCV